jgi:hypothetical protein
MQKFDPSCGLSTKEIMNVKYQISHEITRQLPLLPDHIETILFLQGRDAWMFRWFLQHEHYPISSKNPVSLEVVAKLEKEFHQYQETTQYKFSCKVKLVENDLFHPKITINKIP